MRRLELSEAAALIRETDTLGVPLGPGQPGGLLRALSERDDFRDLRVFGALLLDSYPLFTKPGVTLLSGFYGPVERALHAAGHAVGFVPADFRGFTRVTEKFHARVMATAVAPPDEQGRFSLSLHAGATVQALEACGRDPERLLIVEVNPKLPRTFGAPPDHPHALSAELIDIVVESDRPPPTLPDPQPSETHRAIARLVRDYVSDGATFQTGIGGVPSVVMQLLADAGTGGDYGIHSEMFTTGLMRLHQAGLVTNRKGNFDGFSIATFALGNEELHEWLHENEAVRFLPVDVVNDPVVISRNRQMLSINGALSIDLEGQVVADAIGARQFSGIGGHEDFVRGASMAIGDHSIVCLPSTAVVGERVVSRIQAALPRGSIVTTPRHQVDIIVTEYGAAELHGRTVEERADALIEIAHPDLRDALRRGETDV